MPSSSLPFLAFLTEKEKRMPGAGLFRPLWAWTIEHGDEVKQSFYIILFYIIFLLKSFLSLSLYGLSFLKRFFIWLSLLKRLIRLYGFIRLNGAFIPLSKKENI